jgi:DNA-binding ferritin-like protein
MPIHSLMDEVYQFFGDDNIDWIKERCRILWAYSPTSIFELSKLTQIKELNGPCPAMPELLHVVASDLRTMEGVLENGIQFTGKMWDLVTQNQMINYTDAVWKFRRKIESSIPNEVLPTKSTK